MARQRSLLSQMFLHFAAVVVVLATLAACNWNKSSSPAPSPTPSVTSTEAPDESAGVTSSTPNEANATDSCIPSGADDGALYTDDFKVALLCVVPDFAWPDGRRPDAADFERSLSGLPDGGRGWFERGMVHIWVTGFHECAWFGAWLEARQTGDSPAEAAALDHITNVIARYGEVIPNYPPQIDGPGVAESRSDLAQRAALGDASTVQNYVTYNCGGAG